MAAIDAALRRLAARSAAIACGLLIGASAAAPAWAQHLPLGSQLQGLLDHARTQSPELGAMRHEAEAATQRIAPAGALPDPVLRVELMNVTNYDSSAAPNLLPARVGETKYTLMQSLPLWGKRELRRDAAASDASQAGARVEVGWVELAWRIKAAYAETYRVAGNERLVGEMLALMQSLEQVAQVRYAGGLTGQSDAIRAQLEQTSLRTELILLDSEKRQLRARLNALLARDGAAPLADPQDLRPLPALALADAVALAERARARNPQLAAELARLAGAQTGHELALRNRYPDLTVGIAPSQVRKRLTSWSLMVELSIPLQQETRRSQERETEAMVAAARSRANALQQQLLGELGVGLAGIDAARRSQALVTTQLLPQSELGLQSALAGYEHGKAEFAMVLDAQRQIRKARQELLKAQVDAQLRLAEIERILGEDL